MGNRYTTSPDVTRTRYHMPSTFNRRSLKSHSGYTTVTDDPGPATWGERR